MIDRITTLSQYLPQIILQNVVLAFHDIVGIADDYSRKTSELRGKYDKNLAS